MAPLPQRNRPAEPQATTPAPDGPGALPQRRRNDAAAPAPEPTPTDATSPVTTDAAGGLPVRRPGGPTSTGGGAVNPPAAASGSVPFSDDEMEPRPWADGVAGAPAAPVSNVAAPPRSVFDDLGSSTLSPMLSPSGIASGAPRAQLAATPGATGVPSATAPQLPTMPAGAVPTLPEVIPVSSPTAGASAVDVDAASVPDVRAMRSAQLKQSRQQRQGKVFGRSVIAIFLIAGLIGAALLFGRRYLFPTEWDVRLVPAVDAAQLERGVEFTSATPVVEQPRSRFGLTMSEVVLGNGWTERLPEWRALGLATGATTEETVATRMASLRVAIFDPATATIYLNVDADLSTAAAQVDIRLAVEQSLSHQTAAARPTSRDPDDAQLTARSFVSGFTGLSTTSRLVGEAADRALAGAQIELDGDETDVDTQPFPIPVAYQLVAMNELGDELLAASGIDPGTAVVGDAIPRSVILQLRDDPQPTAPAPLAPGEISVIDPFALGADDWSLVWGSRLPVSTVDLLRSSVIADSYRVVERGGRNCVVAMFDTGSEAAAIAVGEALQVWASTAPGETNTVVAPADGNRIRLDACDPNMIAGTPSLAVVSTLVDQQATRLGASPRPTPVADAEAAVEGIAPTPGGG